MWIKGGMSVDKTTEFKNQNLKFKIMELRNMKYQSIYNRLKRIEGQVRGINEMVASDKPEQDILIQLEAARSSLGSTISNFIETLLSTEKDGKVELSHDQLRAILRAVKK